MHGLPDDQCMLRAIAIFCREKMKNFMGPWMNFRRCDAGFILFYYTDLASYIIGHLKVSTMNRRRERLEFTVEWTHWLNIPMCEGRTLNMLMSVIEDCSFHGYMVGIVESKSDLTRLSLLFAAKESSKRVFIVWLDTVSEDMRKFLSADRDDAKFVLMVKSDTLYIWGDEDEGVYRTFIGKANMRFMDACVLCKSVLPNMGVSC
jgi:hypothetical protein